MQDVSSWSSIASTREVTIVEIKNPITHHKKSQRKYTDFEISLKTNSKAFTLHKSSVRRRYSDFVWLRNWLSENNEGFSSIRKTPSLPPKKLIGRFDKDFIEDRMRGLQRFLRKVLEHNVFLSDKALHLFLQSNLSKEQMENYLTGKPVDCQDCDATRTIVNCDDSPCDGIEQRSLICRLSWKSSLENISKLQGISEDTENSSVDSEAAKIIGDEQSVSSANGPVQRGHGDKDTRSDGIGDGRSKLEERSALECETCTSSPAASSIDQRSNYSEGVCDEGKSLTNSLTEDQQDLQRTENCKSVEETAPSISSLPAFYTFVDSEDSASDIDDPNSSFSIIGSTSPERPAALGRTNPPARSLSDTSRSGFIAAVPITRSPTF